MASCDGKEESDEIQQLSLRIKHLFSSGSKDDDDENLKWCVLREYQSKILDNNKGNVSVISSYYSVVSTLLDSLRPTLFSEKRQENLYDDVFLKGVHHEAFLILVRKLGESHESYAQQKIIDLLQKFLQGSSMESMLLYQCISCKSQDLTHIFASKLWNDIITFIISLPERVANKTSGQMNKIFAPGFYIPLVLSSILKVMHVIHERVIDCQDCSLEFISKLVGRLCITGHADIVAKKLSSEFIRKSESDFVWRRISQKLITKMPVSSLESFTTNLLLVVPWYGYIEWILGDEAIKNQKLNYIMTTKLLLLRHFKKEIILQNIIGYFASSSHRTSHFWNILNTLLESWADESTLKHQSFDQQIYIASTLMVCSGWLKKNKTDSSTSAYINKVLHGTQIRIGSSEASVRSLGMIVGDSLISALNPDAPKLNFEYSDLALLNRLKSLEEIQPKPENDSLSYRLYLEELKCFDEVETEKNKWKGNTPEQNTRKPVEPSIELDSDDDLEPYDMSNDVPEEVKHPLYLRDCMTGLIEQENADWFEQCLKCAESLIRYNSGTVHEVAVEMTKVMLHVEDKYSTPDFIGLRHRIMITLTVHCPVLVANYLTSQFYEKDYNIRQRLDILEVLAASSRELSMPNIKISEPHPYYSKEKFVQTTEQHWKAIIEERIHAKTRHITQSQKKAKPEPKENRFSPVAGYFFFPLLEKYDKQNDMLRLLGDDSYVLGRLMYTLGIIMMSAENIPLSKQMGSTLLQFLVNVRNHSDVFVRQASIFAMATVFTSVPSFMLFSDMLTEILESHQWLKSVIENDTDIHCQIKASHALSLVLNLMKEEMPLLSGLGI